LSSIGHETLNPDTKISDTPKQNSRNCITVILLLNMCIVSGNAIVSDTQILTFPSSDGLRQIMVYSNHMDIDARHIGFRDDAFGNGGYNASWNPSFDALKSKASKASPVVMILPFPEGSCDMIDIGSADGMFSKLSDLFRERTLSMSRAFSKNASTNESITVKRCGPYRYSIIPTLNDFSRVDSSVFEIVPNVTQVLSKHYCSGFSFLVCIIDKTAKYSPVAYSHTLKNRTLFIPTMHEHGDGSADWDHDIYVAGNDTIGEPVPTDNISGDKTDDVSPSLRRILPQPLACLLPSKLEKQCFRKVAIKGNFPNMDLAPPVTIAPEGKNYCIAESEVDGRIKVDIPKVEANKHWSSWVWW
jgi:hypothetical protein